MDQGGRGHGSGSDNGPGNGPGPGAGPGPANGLGDVAGLRVGHAQRVGGGWLSGVTVVLAPEGGAVTAVDVRGGGPGTRETDALDPRNLVQRVEAVVLAGGSAFGLDAASGVAAWLEEHGRGFPVGGPGRVVPVVPAAALFDLGRGGDWHARPDAAMGRAAIEAAAAARPGEPVGQGCVGAGTGAVAGGLKSGVGTASTVLPSGATVAALAVVNAAGSAVDPDTGALWGARPAWADEFGLDGAPLPAPALSRARRLIAAEAEAAAEAAAGYGDEAGSTGAGPFHTTLAVVATDAALSRAQAQKLAGGAHDGLARAVRPAHLLSDGDTVFAMATCARPLLPPGSAGDAAADPAFGVHREAGALDLLLAAGADVLTRAVLHAVLRAQSVETPAGRFLSYRDLYRPHGPAPR
ncbi:P1 family peptidase [Actinacidiphila sp. DG2A-62]|uniref:P1 family peptidase n=1 Tax=Actinacidiphila sp. DG2A-62 TaxID=3108821 RepID=UPI002DBE4DC2|nr:P1 family peptidase [Actinacidiphila sp. DG2A-62]MEC3998800.1 P1 family peptidase [Actinacidiphila sp. DG2A-62]